jgi:serine protease AprX
VKFIVQMSIATNMFTTPRSLRSRQARRNLGALLALGAVATTSLVGATPANASTVTVIVSTADGHSSAVAESIESHGGHVTSHLTALDQLIVEIPSGQVDQLAATDYVTGMALNASVTLSNVMPRTPGNGNGRAASRRTADTTGASKAWARGFDGAGIDVAVIDSGVAAISSLNGRLVNGPDFSTDATNPNLTQLDGFGHGTHMAGVIAGNDPVTGATGVAPSARIVSVKVARYDGGTDIAAVLKALDWVVSKGQKDGFNVRVVNLSFGVEGIPDYMTDPLSEAVEKAWGKGVVVVVSAGNSGNATASLNSPATNPFVIAVGATDERDTITTADDTIAPFSARGSATRSPDMVAPGTGIVSSRVSGSLLDDSYPEARIDDTLFRGNGTSQAAAVVSGAAALLLQSQPKLTPDEVKAILRSTAKPIAGAPTTLQGAGQIDLNAALSAVAPGKAAEQKFTKSGSQALKDFAKLEKEIAKGKTSASRESKGAFDSNRWSSNRWRADRWSSNRWRGDRWA